MGFSYKPLLNITKSDQYTISMLIHLATDADEIYIGWSFTVATEADVHDFYNALSDGNMLAYRMFSNLINHYIDQMHYENQAIYNIEIVDVMTTYNDVAAKHIAIVKINNDKVYPTKYTVTREE